MHARAHTQRREGRGAVCKLAEQSHTGLGQQVKQVPLRGHILGGCSGDNKNTLVFLQTTSAAAKRHRQTERKTN